MTHVAIQEHLDGKTVEWMEKVSDTQYGTAVQGSGASQSTCLPVNVDLWIEEEYHRRPRGYRAR
jgi:hypothetical protein